MRIVLKAVKRRLAVVAVSPFAPLKLKREVTRFQALKGSTRLGQETAPRKRRREGHVVTALPSHEFLARRESVEPKDGDSRPGTVWIRLRRSLSYVARRTQKAAVGNIYGARSNVSALDRLPLR